MSLSHSKQATPTGPVLGENFRRTPRVYTKPIQTSKGLGLSFKKTSKLPKVPRPNRALLLFESVKKGLSEFIVVTQEDIIQLRATETDTASQQLKAAERYLKKLEFHLAKIEELYEYYVVHQQLREGARTMARAYATSPGKQRDSLTNVKFGYKECTQTLCAIEAQFQAMMGTFHCKLKGMVGFARLCPGDVFEVGVRYGAQKWKSRGRVEKDNAQKWDVTDYVFKTLVGDIISIKAVEVRSFKSIVLGLKNCETKDLFSSNPQMMTVSVNATGSLKLSIIITWNPLEGVEEGYTVFDPPPTMNQSTPRKRPVSLLAVNGQYSPMMSHGDKRLSAPIPEDTYFSQQFQMRPQTSQPNLYSPPTPTTAHPSHMHSHYSSTPPPQPYTDQTGDHSTPAKPYPSRDDQASPHKPDLQHHPSPDLHRNPTLDLHHSTPPPTPLHLARQSQSSTDLPLRQSSPPKSVLKNSRESAVQSMMSIPMTPPDRMESPKTRLRRIISSAATVSRDEATTLEEAVQNLRTTLEDYRGSYAELVKLEEVIISLDSVIRRRSATSSRSSSVSVSIESALGAFDFLNTEDGMEELPEREKLTSHGNSRRSSIEHMLASPESTAKTTDSGIESLAKRLSDDTQFGSSLGSSPEPGTTGNEQVDQCLLHHLVYAEKLLDQLGYFGPLKCKEIYALDKLQKQSYMIDHLIQISSSGHHIDLYTVLNELTADKHLREFWTKCVSHNVLYISPDRLLVMFDQNFCLPLKEKYDIPPAKVFHQIMSRLLDLPAYEIDKPKLSMIVTLQQFINYFKEDGLQQGIDNVAAEVWMLEKLHSRNPDLVIKTILTLHRTLPPASCLKVIGVLLICDNWEIRESSFAYLKDISSHRLNRDKSMVVFVEALEDKSENIRCGACAALSVIKATESIDQLVYLCQTDHTPLVRSRAKEALYTLGEEGRKAYDQAQLGIHGFQGIQMKKKIYNY